MKNNLFWFPLFSYACRVHQLQAYTSDAQAFYWLPTRNMTNDMRFEPKNHLLVWVLGCNMAWSLAVWGCLQFAVV